MKKKYKILVVLATLSILLPLFEGLFSISSVWRTNAQDPVLESIISEDFLKVSQSHKVTEEDVIWNIQYEINVKDTSNDGETPIEKAGKLKFILPDTLNLRLPKNQFVKVNNWYVLKDFKKQTKGEIEVTVKKDTKFTMQFQFDEQLLTPVDEVAEHKEEADVSDTKMGETINENILGENKEPVQYEFDYSKYDTNVKEENETKTPASERENKESKNTEGNDNSIKSTVDSNKKIVNQRNSFVKTSDENPYDLQTKKSAQLATEDDAWEKRLYEILLEVSSKEVPGTVSGELIIYLDASSSQNGGSRRNAVFEELKKLGSYLQDKGDFKVMIVPTMAKPNQPAFSQYYQYYTLAELFDEPAAGGKTLAEKLREQYDKNTGANNLLPIMEHLYNNTDYFKNSEDNTEEKNKPIGLIIGGNNINDDNDFKDIVDYREKMHSDMLLAFTDEDKKITDSKMANYQKIITDDSYYFNKSDNKTIEQIIQEAFEKIREMMKIESLKVVDTIPDYFEIVSPTGKEEGIAVENNTVTFDNQTMTKNENTGRYEWSHTIQVKAKDDFIGGNVVATNEESAQVFVDGSDEGKNFDIYGDVKYNNLTTPYVNVKVPYDEIETSQTILLGEAGLSETEIKENWEKDVYSKYRNEDGSFKYGAQPIIKFDSVLDPNYIQSPTQATEDTYQTTGELIPNKFDDKPTALEYVNSYGTVAGNEVPITDQHKGEISAKHKLTVLDTSLEIQKQLNGKEKLPEWFEANFKIAIAPEKVGYFNTESEDFDIDQTNSSGKFTGLGLGEYTITETLSNEETTNRVKQPSPLSLIITKGGTSEKPEFVLNINNAIVTDSKHIVNPWC